MAVSPVTTAMASTQISSAQKAKAKALTVLAGPCSSPLKDAPGNATAGTDLAEQINADVKNRYVKGKKLGEGTYALVFKGHLRTDPSKFVAIKKIKVLDTGLQNGLAMDAIREMKALQELSHPNIITLEAVYSSKNQNLNLVLEYLPLGDLEMLIKDRENIHYTSADIKAWIGMLGRAVWFCHENFVLHRDIKPNNLLIAADGSLKLADFGLARSFSDPYNRMTHTVITRWYRPPELFYRAAHYSGVVDVWSVGCVMGELIIRQPIMAADTDLEQIDVISRFVGTPTEDNWPGVSKLPDYVPAEKDKIVPVHTRSWYMQNGFGTVGSVGIDLLISMLVLDPRKRATAKQVLQHEWWHTDPRPTNKEDLPKPRKGGEDKMGEDLKRRGGELDEGRADKVARKIDFGALKK